ncbi:MAG: hypothetical protein LQ343_006015 [Gyalolechia ehrenbergii]|nr:MAG: hypothetical protein LQ343_006015 [Gyalolechia ehrenbergii]
MSLARELRHSGSDIVVEEDLANVFGRCTISHTLTSSFKTIVAKSNSNISLLEGIVLQGGPGPTVLRALQEPPFFAMVVQISLLAWAFHTNYLATAIADALRKRSEGAPSSSGLPSSPDRLGILGVLEACESQTAAFNWSMMIDAVSITLGYSAETAPTDFPPFVLQGLIDMFPMVQTLPSDRLIHIQIPVGEGLNSGTSVLVVWAHRVLDLVVLVRPRRQGGLPIRDIRFGNPDLEQVFIEEVDAGDEASITLLDSQKEHLLTIRPEPDTEGDLIGSVRRVPAKGWGNFVLEDEMAHFITFQTQSQALIEDLQIMTSAFAFVIAKHMVKGDADRDIGEDTVGMRSAMIYNVDEHRLLQASRFLFDNPRISRGQIQSYVAQSASKPLDDHLSKPPALEAATRTAPRVKIEDEWNIICGHARRLSIFLIALAHVVNLEECENLVFAGRAFSNMFQHTLAVQLEEWNGKDALRIPDDAWLQAIAIPLLGHRTNVWKLPWDKVCLISDRRWSAWISTFGDMDPAYVGAGSVTLGRGSPCRDGVWKSGIWDSAHGIFNFMTDPQRAELCGQAVSLRCAEKVNLETPYCGEGEDVFLVSARFRTHPISQTQRSLQRVGYKELQRYLWWAQISRPCHHGSRMSEDVKLAVGCVTIAGYGNYLEDTEERIVISLTAHTVGARWLALASLPWLSVSGDREEGPAVRQMLLRGDDCCLQCAIDQAASVAGKWFIIL